MAKTKIRLFGFDWNMTTHMPSLTFDLQAEEGKSYQVAVPLDRMEILNSLFQSFENVQYDPDTATLSFVGSPGQGPMGTVATVMDQVDSSGIASASAPVPPAPVLGR